MLIHGLTCIIALESGNPDDSLIFLRKAVRLDDENPEIWHVLGKAHYVKGEKKAALRCFREALKIDVYFNEVWVDLGRIILKDGFLQKALPYLEKAYKIIGDVPGLNYLLASYYLHYGSVDKHHILLLP
jgi:tetratricopeptide (TPR) repeat protein